MIFTIVDLGSTTRSYTTERTNSQIDDVLNEYEIVFISMGIMHFLMSFVALRGALVFNKYMVGIYPIWALFHVTLTIILNFQIMSKVENSFTESVQEDFNFKTNLLIAFQVFILLFWTYPSVMLTREINQGIMSKETYPREEYSCCCIYKRTRLHDA